MRTNVSQDRTPFAAQVALLCFWCVILPFPLASAADPKVDGFAALKQCDYSEASRLFLSAVEASKARKEPKETSDLLFYLGLTQQAAAQEPTAADRRTGLLAEAGSYYSQALGLTPDSSSILNNLAQVYIAQGATDLAKKTLTKAIALGDSDQAFHMQNYAKLLADTGQWKEACRFYSLASWRQPDNSGPLEKLVDLCLANDRDQLCSYLWDLIERGQVLQTQNVALSVLLKPDWSESQKRELLAIVAESLSKQSYDPMKFPASDAANGLQELYNDEIVAEGAREIDKLHRPGALRPNDFAWWRAQVRLSENPRRGKWPLRAFQDLIASLGDYYKAKQNSEAGEKYLRLAVDIVPPSPDPRALVSLADLYARANRTEKLRELIQSNEDYLFSEKAVAYQKHQLNDIYALHEALGSIYASLGQWGNSSQPTSAIFQLEHAVKVTRETRRDPEAKPIELNPALVDRLATGYQKTDQPTKEFQLRLDAAEEFQKEGNPSAAEAVFAPIRDTRPPENLRSRYETIKPMIEARQHSTGIDRPETTGVRVSAESQLVEDQRNGKRLSSAEVSAIVRSVREVIRNESGRNDHGRSIQFLPPKDTPKGIEEIDVEGGRGRVIIEKDSKRVVVPFTVEPSHEKPASVRYIKPKD